MKKVSAYCRVSTDRQKDEQTIDVQKTFLEEWATKNDAVIVEWYLDDGWSGDTLDRPEIDRLREDANKGLWQGVVFIDRDRLARTLAYQEYVIRELRDKNLEVIFLNNPLADTPMERTMQQVYGIVAEMERINIAERMRKGKIHKAKSGKIVGHTAPYGYRYILKVGDRDGYYEIYEPEAEVVKMIFHWVANEGYSLRGVVKELFKRKILPAKKKRDCWTKTSVERLLNRTDYYGVSFYNETRAVVPKNPQNKDRYKRIKKSSRVTKPREEWIEIKVPSIIEKDLYDFAHEKLKENIIYNRRNKKYDYLLTGKTYCQCGNKRVGDGVNGHHYYRSAERIYKFPYPVSGQCKCQGVNAEILDQMVWNKLSGFFSQPDIVEAQIKRWKNKENKLSNKFQSQLSNLKSALKKLTQEEQKVLKAYREDLIDFGKFKEEMNDIKGKRGLMEAQINSITENNIKENMTLGDTREVCEDALNVLQYSSVSDRQAYIRKIVEKVIVGERNSAFVKGYIPLQDYAQNIQDVHISRNCGVAECW